MTRINRPDTLVVELREIKRRLRLLEAARMRPAAATTAASGTEPGPALPPAGDAAPAPRARDVNVVQQPGGIDVMPLVPARPADWPGTGAPRWERLLVLRAPVGGRDARLVLDLVAEPAGAGSTPLGAARVTVDGVPVGQPLDAGATAVRHTVPIAGAAGRGDMEVAVEARRTGGSGTVRVSAVLRLT